MKKCYIVLIKGKKSDRLIKAFGMGCSEYIEDLLKYAILDFKKEKGEDVEIFDIQIREVLQ